MYSTTSMLNQHHPGRNTMSCHHSFNFLGLFPLAPVTIQPSQFESSSPLPPVVARGIKNHMGENVAVDGIPLQTNISVVL
jgi:hypothetical protein